MATSSSLSTAPECPVCAGTGWKTVTVPGKSSRVTRCDCQIAGRNRRLLKQALVPRRYRHCTLADFETDFPNAHRSLAEARFAAERFVNEYPVDKAGLLFSGDIGTGKTHLAVGIIHELIRNKGVPCLFYEHRQLQREILNCYQPGVPTTELEILRPLLDIEVLVLDELGGVLLGKPEWVWTTVSDILNHRYNEEKTTIITTNLLDLTPRDVNANEQTYELMARIRSRLHEMCRRFTLSGMDFRSGPRSVRHHN